MNEFQRHRGPDGEGTWLHPEAHIGLGHNRLSIIDLRMGNQPMCSPSGNVVSFNGEIYNYRDLRNQLGERNFQTKSDTETLLKSYEKWGVECLNQFRGMFAFALWDESRQILFCARDRLGIKPFYYVTVDSVLYFASEIKALLPFVPEIQTDEEGLKDYLAFQFTLGDKTLFKHVKQLLPGHYLTVEKGRPRISRYWEVYYNLDFDHTEKFFIENVKEMMSESIRYHLQSDVPVGAYISGGLDSSIIAALGQREMNENMHVFHGFFPYGKEYNENVYAREFARKHGMKLFEREINSGHFVDTIRKIIYHLDTPVAGPGSFPQYHVSKLASETRKVVLGGQGGDEIFGGYTRYLIAYFEQCIKGAVHGTLQNGNFIVTYESIIPNLIALQKYEPLLKHFWSAGLFEDLDKRYFHLIDRAPSLSKEINWNEIQDYSPYLTFRNIFLGDNVGHESYFDLMTHFDFKTLLPALLHVEDRMSMAHGLESRVPMLDHSLIELLATIPSNIKFKNGELKRLLKITFDKILPKSIVGRQDKMGFPVPLTEWMQGELKEFVVDIFTSHRINDRKYFNYQSIKDGISKEKKFSRKIWGLLSLELWMQEFHDRDYEYKALLNDRKGIVASQKPTSAANPSIHHSNL